MHIVHSSAYLADEALRARPRRLRAGTAAMQDAAENHIDMWPGPGENRNYYLAEELVKSGGLSIYENKIRQSVLSPAWWDSVRRSALAPLRETILLAGWGDRLIEWARNLDGSGRSRVQIMMETLENQAVDGVAFMLADLETMEGEDGKPVVRSLGDDDRAGRRPYTVPLSAIDVDPVSVGRIGGETALLRCLIYQESATRASVTENENKAAFWREYELRGDDVYRRNHLLKEADRNAEIEKQTEWRRIEPLGAGRLLRIPLTPFYGDFTTGPYRGVPPYGRPAEMAAAAWRKRADKDQLARENARLRFFQNHVPLDERGSPKVKMLANFLYSTEDGDAKVLETSAAALKELREDLKDDENAIRTACRALAAERTSGDITATEIGLRGLESGAYQEVVTQGNAASLRRHLQDLEALGGESPSEGTVDWRFKATQQVASETLDRVQQLVETGLLPVETLLYLDRAAGGLPENLDIAAAVAGTLEED